MNENKALLICLEFNSLRKPIKNKEKRKTGGVRWLPFSYLLLDARLYPDPCRASSIYRKCRRTPGNPLAYGAIRGHERAKYRNHL